MTKEKINPNTDSAVKSVESNKNKAIDYLNSGADMSDEEAIFYLGIIEGDN